MLDEDWHLAETSSCWSGYRNHHRGSNGGPFEGNTLLLWRWYPARDAVQHPYTAIKPAGKGAALPWLSWAFSLLFAGVFKKKIYGHHSNHRLPGMCGFPQHTWGPGTFTQGLSTLPRAEAVPALASPPRPCKLPTPARGGCTQLARFLPLVVDAAEVLVPAWG